MHGFAMHGIDVGALEMLTDLCGNPDGTQIIGGDEADDMVDPGGFQIHASAPVAASVANP